MIDDVPKFTPLPHEAELAARGRSATSCTRERAAVSNLHIQMITKFEAQKATVQLFQSNCEMLHVESDDSSNLTITLKAQALQSGVGQAGAGLLRLLGVDRGPGDLGDRLRPKFASSGPG